MTIEDESYNLRSLGEGLNAIVHVDPSKYPSCTTTSDFQNLQNNNGSVQNNGDAFSRQKQNILSKSSSPAAKNAEGGTNAINALINSAIAEANVSYVNSNIPIQLQLAHKVEVNYTEVSTRETVLRECPTEVLMSKDLLRFQDPSDGYMDEIQDLRAGHAADVAVLIFDPQFATCGEAFDWGPPASGTYCVVAHNCAAAASRWSLAHEIGHLQGARHEIEQDNCTIPYSNGHGKVLSTTPLKKTMMAIKGGIDRIQYWSNPSVTFQGVPTGDATSNNAFVLSQTASSISNFAIEITEDITSPPSTVTWNSFVLIPNPNDPPSTFELYVDGVTLTIGSGAVVVVEEEVRLIAINGGNIKIESGARVCLEPFAEIIADDNSYVNDNGGNICFYGTGACLATTGGTLKFTSGLTRTVDNGGFIAGFASGGTIEIEG